MWVDFLCKRRRLKQLSKVTVQWRSKESLFWKFSKSILWCKIQVAAPWNCKGLIAKLSMEIYQESRKSDLSSYERKIMFPSVSRSDTHFRFKNPLFYLRFHLHVTNWKILGSIKKYEVALKIIKIFKIIILIIHHLLVPWNNLPFSS